MRVIELFSGIGGFRLGLERAGHKVVWANEWLEKPRRIYKRNFGEFPDARDIRTIDPSELPTADLICGGFPCATFSLAGKRTGFSSEDTRGTLFFEICRFLRVTRTPYVLLENVKGLLNHGNGKSFAVILSALDELGYDCQWEVCNSKNFGVPQNRERVFIIGNLRGTTRFQVFPLRATEAINFESKSLHRKETARTVQARLRKGIGNTESRIVGTLIKACGERLDSLQEIEDCINRNEPIRKLTPLECERLQGLPDNYTKFYEDGTIVNDAERYERCGRTVTIPIIEEIGKRLGAV